MYFAVFSEEEILLVNLDLAVLSWSSYSVFYKLPFSFSCINVELLLFVVFFFLLPEIKYVRLWNNYEHSLTAKLSTSNKVHFCIGTGTVLPIEISLKLKQDVLSAYIAIKTNYTASRFKRRAKLSSADHPTIRFATAMYTISFRWNVLLDSSP